MSSAKKVGEIFAAAGDAFTKLGELTMQLHGTGETTPTSGKWSDNEIDQLHAAVITFGSELHSISDNIKNRTIAQIKGQLKRKAFTEAGVNPEEEAPPVKVTKRQVKSKHDTKKEMTLTALNADVEEKHDGVGFDSAHKGFANLDPGEIPIPIPRNLSMMAMQAFSSGTHARHGASSFCS